MIMDYLKIFLSLGEINIPKDCLKIIISYVEFTIEYIKSIDFNDIKKSEYFIKLN